MEGLMKQFNEFMNNRTEELWREGYGQNIELIRLEGKLIELQGALLGQLGQKEKELFFQYEELINQEIAYLRQGIYKLGFRDGIKIIEGANDGCYNLR